MSGTNALRAALWSSQANWLEQEPSGSLRHEAMHAKVGGTGLDVSPHGEGYTQATNKSVYMHESSSLASMALVLGRNGEAEVTRRARTTASTGIAIHG
jgi:hypothetical protein